MKKYGSKSGRKLIRKMMALSLAASMMFSSSGFEILAQESGNQAVEQELSAEENAKTLAAKESEAESEKKAKAESEAESEKVKAQSEAESEKAKAESEKAQSEEEAKSESAADEADTSRDAAGGSTQAEQTEASEDAKAEASDKTDDKTSDKTETSDKASDKADDKTDKDKSDREEKEELPEETAAAELSVTAEQEVFTEADGTLAVKYIISVNNKTEKTDAEDITVKAVLGEQLSYYKKDGETDSLAFVEQLAQIPAGYDLDELKTYTAQELEKYTSAVIWKDQTITGGVFPGMYSSHVLTRIQNRRKTFRYFSL